jgi:hypothetical protein
MDDDKLNTVANLAQLYTLFLLFRDTSNDQIMKELQNQNTNYFEEILKQLKRIEEKIDGNY